jgi:hypothetical protein
MLLLEGARKKGGRVAKPAVERAEMYRAEWNVTKSSDPIDQIS